MVWIVYPLINLKENEELKICEVHYLFFHRWIHWVIWVVLKPVIPVYKDYVSMISLCSKARMKQQQYLKIHTHVCSHASEMLLRVIWQLNYKYLKKICIFFLLFFFIYNELWFETKWKWARHTKRSRLQIKNFILSKIRD